MISDSKIGGKANKAGLRYLRDYILKGNSLSYIRTENTGEK